MPHIFTKIVCFLIFCTQHAKFKAFFRQIQQNGAKMFTQENLSLNTRATAPLPSIIGNNQLGLRVYHQFRKRNCSIPGLLSRSTSCPNHRHKSKRKDHRFGMAKKIKFSASRASSLEEHCFKLRENFYGIRRLVDQANILRISCGVPAHLNRYLTS